MVVGAFIVSSSFAKTDSTSRYCYYHYNDQQRQERQQHTTELQASSSGSNQLEQLSKVTTLSIDSGDLNIVKQYVDTGYITDATTNPLFVSQAGTSSSDNVMYSEMISNAVTYAVEQSNLEKDDLETIVALSMERLSVELGSSISQIVKGYVSTEVDPRLSFDTEASIERALRIIDMYTSDKQIAKERVLIKLAATWEGIKAAEILERDYNIKCNLTLIFSMVQAVACAQANVHLISPFPGRVLDWYNSKLGRPNGVNTPQDDEGVKLCSDIYNYYKTYNHDTICMPASWRPSRGVGYELDEIRALAGSDRMTIPAPLLEKLTTSMEPLECVLTVEKALLPSTNVGPEWGSSTNNNGRHYLTETEFRYMLTMDGCGNDKLSEGIRAFVDETNKLQDAMTPRVQKAIAARMKTKNEAEASSSTTAV